MIHGAIMHAISHVIVINELHAVHQAALDKNLAATALGMHMLGWPKGDALICKPKNTMATSVPYASCSTVPEMPPKKAAEP